MTYSAQSYKIHRYGRYICVKFGLCETFCNSDYADYADNSDYAEAHLTNPLFPRRLLFQLQLQRLLGSEATKITSSLPTSPLLLVLPLYLVRNPCHGDYYDDGDGDHHHHQHHQHHQRYLYLKTLSLDTCPRVTLCSHSTPSSSQTFI